MHRQIPGSRLVLMQYHFRAGRKAEARGELEAILALNPPNAAELRERFGPLLR